VSKNVFAGGAGIFSFGGALAMAFGPGAYPEYAQQVTWGGIAALVLGIAVMALTWARSVETGHGFAPVRGNSSSPLPHGSGGKGGDAIATGDYSIAIGGPGGRGGTHGSGGDGGSGPVNGNYSISAGGEGGHAGEIGVWKPPARSGYEIFQRRLGLPVDPFMAQFGRGGTSVGWYDKMKVVEGLRDKFFKAHPNANTSDVHAVPLEYLNAQISELREPWRARIIDDQYEFFIPET
jgi:hypothetical protein